MRSLSTRFAGDAGRRALSLLLALWLVCASLPVVSAYAYETRPAPVARPFTATWATVSAGSVALPCSISSPAYSGAVSSTNAFTVSWSVTGASPAASYDVQSADGASGLWTAWLSSTTATSQVFTGVAGHTYFFRVRAHDGSGAAGDFSNPVRTSLPADDASMSYSSGWKKASQSGAYLGATHYATAKGKTASYTFTGSAVVLLVTKAKTRGKADIYLDGKRVKTVDTYASKTYTRQAVYSASVASGRHTLKVSVLATSRRPRVDVDGVEVYTPHTGPPVVTAALEGGACTGSCGVMLSLSCADGYGPTSAEVSEDPSFAGAVFVPYSSELPFTLSASDGPKTVRVRVRDAFGTLSAPVVVGAVLDTTPPQIGGCSSATFSSGSPYTVTANVTDASALNCVLHARPAGSSSFQDLSMTVSGATAQATLSAALLGSGPLAYYVTAVDAAGNSSCLPAGAPGAVFTLTPGVVPPPPVPSGLGAVCGNHSCALSWDPVAASGVAGYRLYRAPSSSGPWTQVADAASSSTTDSGALNGHTYYYAVSCYGGSGAESAKCTPVTAVLPARLGSFQVSAPLTVTSGTAFTVTVIAYDDNGEIFTGFVDPVTLSTDGAGDVSPTTVSGFSGGVASPQVTYTGTGTIHVRVADGPVAAASGAVSVSAAGQGPPPSTPVLTSFTILTDQSATIDQPFTITIIAYDQNGQPFTSYNGTVSLSAPGPGVLSPLTASGFSGGLLQTTVSYSQKAVISIHAQDGAVSGNSGSINMLLPGECGCGG